MTPWSEWEDWLSGMYGIAWTDPQAEASFRLLGDPVGFGEAAVAMLADWPNSAVQNLAHMWSGRNAWVGQATCMHAHGAPALATRTAWGLLSNDQQRAANDVAVRVREDWERRRDGAEALFADD